MKKQATHEFGEIDWHEFNEVIAGRGPCNHERIEARRKAWENGKWVRDAAVVYAKNSSLKRTKWLNKIYGKI